MPRPASDLDTTHLSKVTQAQCVDCPWESHSRRTDLGRHRTYDNARTQAKIHVRKTGHQVSLQTVDSYTISPKD